MKYVVMSIIIIPLTIVCNIGVICYMLWEWDFNKEYFIDYPDEYNPFLHGRKP